MFTFLLYVHTGRNNVIMLRVFNNRRKAELSMDIRATPEELEQALSGKDVKTNKGLMSSVAHWMATIIDVRAMLEEKGLSNMPACQIRDEIKAALFSSQDCIFEDGHVGRGRNQSKGKFIRFFRAHADKYDKRSTRESNLYTISVLYRYEKSDDAPDIPIDAMQFKDLNYGWLEDFERWMKKIGLSQNTRKIHFGNIRTAMRAAYKRELTDCDPFRRFSFKPAKTRKRSLDVNELRKLAFYPVEPYQEYYRDMFLLIFMLIGINTVDLVGLKSIEKGRIEYRRSKTNGLFSIKVEPEAVRLIEKYKGVKALLNIKDRWSDYRNFRHQLNEALRSIGPVQRQGRGGKKEFSPLFPELTSYWARHTWATIAADLDIPDAVISMALGHAGENRVTNIYIKRNMAKIDAANRKVLDWVFYNRRGEQVEPEDNE